MKVEQLRNARNIKHDIHVTSLHFKFKCFVCCWCLGIVSVFLCFQMLAFLSKIRFSSLGVGFVEVVLVVLCDQIIRNKHARAWEECALHVLLNLKIQAAAQKLSCVPRNMFTTDLLKL